MVGIYVVRIKIFQQREKDDFVVDLILINILHPAKIKINAYKSINNVCTHRTYIYYISVYYIDNNAHVKPYIPCCTILYVQNNKPIDTFIYVV